MRSVDSYYNQMFHDSNHLPSDMTEALSWLVEAELDELMGGLVNAVVPRSLRNWGASGRLGDAIRTWGEDLGKGPAYRCNSKRLAITRLIEEFRDIERVRLIEDALVNGGDWMGVLQ